MRRAAFYLVASVIGIQMLIVASALAGCFFMPQSECTGEKAQDILSRIMTEVFALYASEKG